MTKYFKNVKSFEDLKNQFKVLARKNHPDAGGSADIMKEINCEYDALFPIWKDRHNATVSEEDKTQETAESTRRWFYTENGWEGSRYDSSLSTTDISKIIKNYCKEKYPTWKFSVTSKYFSGGSEILICVMEAPVDIFDREYFKLPVSDDKSTWSYGERRDCWDMEKMTAENSYYMQLYSISDKENHPYLNEIGYATLKDVYDFMQSYNYDDSDSMIDYFSCEFYSFICIGKWNKGFRIVPKTARIKNKETKPRQKRKSTPKQEKAPEINQKAKYTYKITQGEDTRDGSMLWIVRIKETLDKATYIKENNHMKDLGGYYSKFKHGFIFRFDPTEKLGA